MTGSAKQWALVLGTLVASSSLGATAAELTFDLKIHNGQIPDSMRLVRVHEGDVVRLRCTADQPVVLHLHGYDIEKRITPKAVTELRFTAYATGRFPIHIHQQAGRSGNQTHEDEPLVEVEVYPR
jgi:hypothetical protein